LLYANQTKGSNDASSRLVISGGDDFVPVPGARPMCAATVENGLVDFEQVKMSALTGFPSQTTLSEEKNLLR
jgi:hypothetical protein